MVNFNIVVFSLPNFLRGSHEYMVSWITTRHFECQTITHQRGLQYCWYKVKEAFKNVECGEPNFLEQL